MRMTLEILLLISVVALLSCFFLYFAQTLYSPGLPSNTTGSVCFKKNCFGVELAITKAQIERGLMHREELDKDKGMLFIFKNESRQSFWMKNTLIPLDIIWIDKDGKVIFISKKAQPCSGLICPALGPQEKAKYVLEIGGGMCDQIGLGVGDRVKISTGEILDN